MKGPTPLKLSGVDRSLPVAVHEQLRDSISEQLAIGRAVPGDRLPSVQEFAKLCGVSVTTVQRALAELEQKGEIVRRHGSGTYVAERPAPTVEILVHQMQWLVDPRGTYVTGIVRGLQAGFREGERRVVITHYPDSAPTKRELVEMCRIRRTDSLVSYRPDDALADVMRDVAEDTPATSLFAPVPDSCVDCVTVDPIPALRRLLEERLREGREHFVYAGVPKLARLKEAPGNPYIAIRDCFESTLGEADVAYSLLTIADPAGQRNLDDLVAGFGQMPEGAVVVAANPHLADALLRRSPSAVAISYTEHRPSADEFRGRMSLLFADIECVAQEAVPLLRSRIDGDFAGPARTVCLEPVVYSTPSRKEA